MNVAGRSGRDSPSTAMPADAAGHGPPTGPPPGPALPAMGGWGGRMLMPGPWTGSVIHSAIGRRQEMTTDHNEQSVISQLQPAQIADCADVVIVPT
jgi:hypothetical protein